MSDLNERSFIGSLLHLPAERVIDAARVVEVDDLADPRLQTIYRTIIVLAVDGVTPDPPRVDAAARSSGAIRASDHAAFVGEIVDLYTKCPNPGAVAAYGRAVVEAAVRRRITAAGTRLAQAADGESLESLSRLAASETAAVLAAIERLADPRILAVTG